jgi:hypothetical protein
MNNTRLLNLSKEKMQRAVIPAIAFAWMNVHQTN